MNRIRSGWLVAIFTAAALLASAGCASSEGAESSSSDSAGGAESKSEEEGGERGRMEVRERVHFEEILGKEVRGDKPPGCTGEWEPFDSSTFPGESYVCSKFNGPEQWGDIPVTMAIHEGRLAVISVQVFFDSVGDARSEFTEFTGQLIDRCDRKTGFERYEVFDCGDYYLDVAWDPGHAQAEMRVIYATSYEVLKQNR